MAVKTKPKNKPGAGRPVGSTRAAAPRVRVLSLDGPPEGKEWFDRLCASLRLYPQQVGIRALEYLAEREGFAEPSPFAPPPPATSRAKR